MTGNRTGSGRFLLFLAVFRCVFVAGSGDHVNIHQGLTNSSQIVNFIVPKDGIDDQNEERHTIS